MTPQARHAVTQERGSAVLVALIVLLAIGVLGASLSSNASSDVLIAGNYRENQRAFYAADGGVHAAFEALVQEAENGGVLPGADELDAVDPPTLTGSSYENVEIRITGADAVGAIPSGVYQGLHAMSRPYEATVTALTDTAPAGRATVRMSAILDLIPVFQFAIFSEESLQFNPNTMTVAGRVHTNSDAYFNSWASLGPLTFEDVVTVVGEVYNYDPWVGDGRGRRLFRDADGNYVDLGGLTSLLPGWHDLALARWDGNLRSGVHGVEPMRLPMPDGISPRAIIDPPSADDEAVMHRAKLYYRSDLRILNGVATDSAGVAVSIVDPVSGDPAIRPTVIWDEREGHEMLVLEIDVEKLSRSDAWPDNGSLYVGLGAPGGTVPGWQVPEWDDSTSSYVDTAWPTDWSPYGAPYLGGDTDFAVKLVNGEHLPSPFTVASDNPVYVKGPYNRVNKQPASIIADAVTILSPNWGRKNGGSSGGRGGRGGRRGGGTAIPPNEPDDDEGYSRLPMTSRDPADAIFNFSYMAGTTAADEPPRGNGGPQNFLRMLEDWAGEWVTWSGSAVVMWRSRYADATFDCCWYYTVPYRDFSFDTDLLDPDLLPPNTPSLFQVRVSDWTQE